MCSPRNDKYNRSYSKTELSVKSLLRTWFLCFSWLSFFAFWEVEKHVFHITSFRPTSYVLMRLKWLEVSNRVRSWKKEKNSFSWSRKLNYANWNSNIHIQINVSEFTNKIVSFLFCEFNRVTSRKKQKYFFRTFIFSNSQIQILLSFSWSTKVNVNMSFPNSNF